MNSQYVKMVVLGAAVAAFVAVQLAPWDLSEKEGVAEAVVDLQGEWVDRPAPDFQLPNVDTGQQMSLSDFRGKVIFLNFWASFCEPCRREMPSMENLVRQYKNRGLEMVAVSLDPEQQDINKFMNEFLPGQRSAMTVLWDAAGQSSQAYGTEFIPETYIIDRQGRIVARFVNEYDWTRPEAKQLIEALL
ncbi:TlpA family protein disulfide reductase [Persicimonas caeni]|uniref:TlpA family protein disulfide reductase n=1 Tax=Persicimonas caeni TaxID=2292766 RepID=A0A4Y6PN10_PERCE|nr:TlpA disulfide reductase family protein [Persicimonas caeni]QDG49691.1 TlpA family protein disulfide reductase [Persicimonas caeni]QED30912.1 TlpA family protein disulfide reductase [Persicimonas caeni]